MEFKLINPKDIVSLEDYLITCLTSVINLEALEKFHIRAVEIGILKEDQECLANSIVWDIRRLQKLLKDQSESVLELLPHNFSVTECIQKFMESHAESIKKVAKTRKRNAVNKTIKPDRA